MDSAQLAKLAAVAGVSGAAVALLVAKLLDGGARRAQASVSEDKPEDKPSLPRPLERQASSVVDAHVCSSERVQKFVLTGGPCGGKTTALARLREFFEERGFRVVCLPGLEPHASSAPGREALEPPARSAPGREACCSHARASAGAVHPARGGHLYISPISPLYLPYIWRSSSRPRRPQYSGATACR